MLKYLYHCYALYYSFFIQMPNYTCLLAVPHRKCVMVLEAFYCCYFVIDTRWRWSVCDVLKSCDDKGQINFLLHMQSQNFCVHNILFYLLSAMPCNELIYLVFNMCFLYFILCFVLCCIINNNNIFYILNHIFDRFLKWLFFLFITTVM